MVKERRHAMGIRVVSFRDESSMLFVTEINGTLVAPVVCADTGFADPCERNGAYFHAIGNTVPWLSLANRGKSGGR